MQPKLGSLTTLSILQTDNLLPPKSKKPSASPSQKGIQLFNADDIGLQQAAGDFNCVIELSADLCLRAFDFDFQKSVYQLTIKPADLKSFFASQTSAFDSTQLNQLAATDPTKITYINGTPILPKGLTLLVRFTPISLVFGTGQSLTISYLASVSIGALFPVHETGDSLGSLTVDIEASWTTSSNPTLKQLDAYVDLTGAKVSISSGTSDAKRMYDGGLFGVNGATIATFLLNKPQVHLTPTMSLVGKDNAANAAVSELPDFQVQVAVVQWLGQQALAAAFQVNPGCTPAIADVEHFIGLSDYGVISDEFLISGLFHHKWDLGGFLRSFPFHETITVKENGNVVDATLYGTMQLETLDSVSLVPDSNLRTDCVVLAGTAVASAQYLILPDQTKVAAGQDGLDFGPPVTTGWALKNSPAVKFQLPANAPSLAFVEQAYHDAYRHLGRPFARFPDPIANAQDPLYVNYVRVEAVVHRMFSLASVSDIFI